MKKYFAVFVLTVFCVSVFSGCGIIFSKLSDTDSEMKKVFKNLDDGFAPLGDFVVEMIADDLMSDYENKIFEADVVLADGIESKVSVSFEKDSAVVSVDGQSIEVFGVSPVCIAVVDIDITDKLREIAICVDGYSGDPGISFVRYDGRDLYALEHYVARYDMVYTDIYGDIKADESAVGPTYGAIWCNGKGRVVTSFDNMGFTDERVAFVCYDAVGREWKETVLNAWGDIQGEYTVSKAFTAFYTPTPELPHDLGDARYLQNFDPEKSKEFEEGKSITVITYAEIHNYYAFYIEYEGERGVITFWMGD